MSTTSDHNGLSSWQEAEFLDPEAARLTRQDIIRSRLSDLIEADPLEVAITLGNLSLATFAQCFPAKLSKEDRQKITENYPKATPDLIAERAMSEEGVLHAVCSFTQLARICIDYFPESNTTQALKTDTKAGQEATQTLRKGLETGFAQAVAAGMSPFGVGTTTILFGMLAAVKQGVPWPAITKTLLESIEHAQKMDFQARTPSAAEMAQIEEQAIQSIMQKMGVSRATARKYLAEAKQWAEEGK